MKFLNAIFNRGDPLAEPLPVVGPREPGRPRVLVESTDMAERYSIASILSREGFDVVTCGGPEVLGKPCPLISGAACQAVSSADTVFYRLDLPDAENEAILRALKSEAEKRPVVVEVPGPRADQMTELLEGCRVLRMPASVAQMVAAITEATAGTHTV